MLDQVIGHRQGADRTRAVILPTDCVVHDIYGWRMIDYHDGALSCRRCLLDTLTSWGSKFDMSPAMPCHAMPCHGNRSRLELRKEVRQSTAGMTASRNRAAVQDRGHLVKDGMAALSVDGR